MIEIHGNIWEHFKKGVPICITTNGFVKENGDAVMGAGVAKQAKFLFPDLPKELGNNIRKNGNRVFYFEKYNIFTFPVKHYWWQNADIDLIKKSLNELVNYIDIHNIKTVILPKPGCGNGRLNWKIVKENIDDICTDNIKIISY